MVENQFQLGRFIPRVVFFHGVGGSLVGKFRELEAAMDQRCIENNMELSVLQPRHTGVWCRVEMW
jgi:hypothetical protein